MVKQTLAVSLASFIRRRVYNLMERTHEKRIAYLFDLSVILDYNRKFTHSDQMDPLCYIENHDAILPLSPFCTGTESDSDLAQLICLSPFP